MSTAGSGPSSAGSTSDSEYAAPYPVERAAASIAGARQRRHGGQRHDGHEDVELVDEVAEDDDGWVVVRNTRADLYRTVKLRARIRAALARADRTR